MSDLSTSLEPAGPFRYRCFVKGDIDGFFGLMIDNLVQILLIVSLCRFIWGTGSDGLIFGTILPAAAVSILFGNLFYSYQAWRLARRERRSDVTAMPYGINTVSLIAYIFFVMKPAYDKAGGAAAPNAATVAWQVGLLACFGSGVIEFIGAFFAGLLRKVTPRAALLGTLGAIAVALIAAQFAFEIFANPLVALVPLAVILLQYFAKFRFPFGLPGGLIAVAAGTIIAWALSLCGAASPVSGAALAGSFSTVGLKLPTWQWPNIAAMLGQPEQFLYPYLPVIIPMGLMSVLGSLQNIESAEAAGDRYRPVTSLAVDGLGTLVASLLGSCFPTTMYIGHPGWKGLGARAGYSVYNGVFFTLICLLGLAGVLSSLIPLSAGAAILLWIGIIITAQAFEESPKRHAPAIAFGLLPAVGALCVLMVTGALGAAGGRSLQDLLTNPMPGFFDNWPLAGMLCLDAGFIFTCTILIAMLAAIIDRRFGTAAVWAIAACGLTILGLIHSYVVVGNSTRLLPIFEPTPEGAAMLRPWLIAVGYAATAAILLLCRMFARGQEAASHVQRALGKPAAMDELIDSRLPRRRPPTRRPPAADGSAGPPSAEAGAFAVAGAILGQPEQLAEHEHLAPLPEEPPILTDHQDEELVMHPEAAPEAEPPAEPAAPEPAAGVTKEEAAALSGEAFDDFLLAPPPAPQPPPAPAAGPAEPPAPASIEEEDLFTPSDAAEPAAPPAADEFDFLADAAAPPPPPAPRRRPPAAAPPAAPPTEKPADQPQPDAADALAALAGEVAQARPEGGEIQHGTEEEDEQEILDLIDEIDDEETDQDKQQP